jgi:hypothetical protein
VDLAQNHSWSRAPLEKGTQIENVQEGRRTGVKPGVLTKQNNI